MPARKKLTPPSPPVVRTNNGIPVHCKFDKLVEAAALIANPKNYRQHPASQVARLKALVEANGWRRAIVVSSLSGLIITGHGAMTAGVAMDDTVPVEYQHFSSPEEEARHLIADNKASEGAQNDDAALSALLKEISELTPAVVGMDSKEFDRLLKSAEDLAAGEEAPPEKRQAVSYTLKFDDKAQRDAWNAWLRKLKAELPDLPSAAARIMFAVSRQ